MVAPIRDQERRIAARLLRGGRMIIKADGAWMKLDGQERWVSDKWVARMEAHGLIASGSPSILSYHEWYLTPEGEAVARG